MDIDGEEEVEEKKKDFNNQCNVIINKSTCSETGQFFYLSYLAFGHLKMRTVWRTL